MTSFPLAPTPWGFPFRVPFALDAYLLEFSPGIREDYGYQSTQYEALDSRCTPSTRNVRHRDLERYLGVFEGVEPRVGVIGDAFDAADVRALVTTARQLQERLPGFEPIIVPKCAAALTIIPEEIVVGYPMGYSEIQTGEVSRPPD